MATVPIGNADTKGRQEARGESQEKIDAARGLETEVDQFAASRNPGLHDTTGKSGAAKIGGRTRLGMNNGSDKLEALRKKEAALKTAIAAEQVKQQKRKERENARLFSIVGQALVENAAKNPDGLGLMVKQVLQAAELRETDRAFLAGRGWL